ncbi:TPA: radical SAM protein [Clostridium perfringens]|uniref:Uncharacterized protein n=1 Tax=Clostridium perfringens TaxID=1502 RepID=A0A4Y5T3N8_CLOPF|nr:hypothetical protein [Clostridium perfringens]HAT4340559.1 radical SAM protein [Clostridium perfringens]HAT4346124.1 radical SAM protein [Clostridium perfringens]
MKDIIFINPPGLRTGSYFPVGIGYLNQILINKDINSKILDIYNMIIKKELFIDENTITNIESLIYKNPAKIYAITVNCAALVWSVEICKIIRKVYKNSKIIVGGPHVTVLGEDNFKANKYIDYAIVFEGEKVIYDIVRSILDNNIKNIKNIKNIYFLNKDKEIEFSGYADINKELDDLPKINIDMREYNNITGIAVDVGRGCPLECYFCETNYIWNKKSRFKSIEKISEESQFYFNKIRDKKKPLVHFSHDNFLINKSIIKKLVDEKNKNLYDFSYACTTRIDFIDEESIELLVKSSCKNIFFGIETGSKRIQKISKKNIDTDKIIDKIRLLCENKIFVETNYIIGFPEETLDEVYETLELMSNVRWVNPTYSAVDCNLMSPVTHSKLGQATKEDDLVFNELHRVYLDLLRAKIDIDKDLFIYNKYFFTIKNKNYDILKARDFTMFYLGLLTGYPVSLYLLIKKSKISINNINKSFNKMTINNEMLKNIDIQFEFLENLFEKYNLIDFKEILLFEKARLDIINKNFKNVNKLNFSKKIKDIYKILKYDPSQILKLENRLSFKER